MPGMDAGIVWSERNRLMKDAAFKRDIIVIGASAGGVQALQILVAALSKHLPAALFLVLHIPASLPSTLPSILRRSGSLPALHATEGAMIEQGKLYIAPPDHHLLLKQGHMHLDTGPKEHRVRPAVDVLFRSAATTYGSRVVGIILTGTGDDGTAGLLAVKQHGGVTIVQNPAEARFPAMPQSARAQVQVDYTSPLEKIASLLVLLVQPETQFLAYNTEK
jgi:two-component system chemotaxis response regulator CheB